MNTLYLILLIIAAVCFALAAFGKSFKGVKVNFLALGLLAWVLVPLLQRLD